MDVREFYVDRLKQEFPAFIKVLKALPEQSLAYKPHERSPSAEQLVWTLAAEQAACVEFAEKARYEWKATPPPPLEEMIALFERAHTELVAQVSKMDDAAWERQGTLIFDGKVMMEPPVGQFLWFLLFDAIHHRGQLAAYLRPMGGKVPSIYGPSADDPGQ
jgi:uncharacterized damage-inducible protein DinB